MSGPPEESAGGKLDASSVGQIDIDLFDGLALLTSAFDESGEGGASFGECLLYEKSGY